MSVQPQSVDSDTEEPTVECGHCGEEFPDRESVAGSFCSTRCYYEHKGSKALNRVESDHRFCASCYSRVKVVEEPSDDWVEDRDDLKAAFDAGGSMEQVGGELVLDITTAGTHRRTASEAVVGYQYPTEHTEFAEDVRPGESGGEYTHRKKVRGVYGCQCGSIDLRNRDRMLASIEGAQVIYNLLACLKSLYEQGALDSEVDRKALVEALTDTGSLEYAIGVGLEGEV